MADNADTDGDSIPDGTEVLGFDLGSTHWDSDPLNSDSNRDGIPDTREWSKTLTPNGLAVTDDIDSDGFPNIWDEDDDGDEVPDAFDISPNALTDYTTEFNLTTQGTMTTGTEAIEIEVQPLEKDHLRYSTTVLDWPYDEEGNIRDLNDSKLDLRLTPFLLVTTNVQPTQELLEQYGTKAWYDEEQGKNVLLITLQPLEDGGAVYAFYGKVAYEAVQTGDIQWNAKVVWMAQMQADTNVCHYVYYAGHDECEIETEATILHQYQETFRITGLTVTKSESYEASVMGTPSMTTDDRYLFQLFVGLNNTYQAGHTLEGQTGDETALEELYSRFTSAAYLNDDYHTFDIPRDTVAMSLPTTYRNSEEGMADLSNNILPNFLDYYPAFASAANCFDVEHKSVTCATLVLASETHTGMEDLSMFRGADPRMVDLETLNVNLDSTPVIVVRTTNLRMYEQDPATDKWQTMMPARMLEMVEARYHGVYGDSTTVLSTLYPNLRSSDARFIAYTGYLWAYGGNLTVVSVDGQVVIPEVPDEAASDLNTAIANEMAVTGLDYVGLASSLPAEFSDAYGAIQGTVDIIATILDRANLTRATIGGKITLSGFAIAAAVASLIMNCLNTACAANPDLNMCGHETAFLVANLLVGTFVITMQVIAITVQIVSAVIDHIAKVVASVSASTVILGFIGAAVGIVMAWVAFGILAGTVKNSDPAAFRVSLGMAIVTTIWLIFLACLNFIPLIGQIISGILAIIDYIIGLFTGLFTDSQWSISRILLELFYSAETRTSIKSGGFGTFSSGLDGPGYGAHRGEYHYL